MTLYENCGDQIQSTISNSSNNKKSNDKPFVRLSEKKQKETFYIYNIYIYTYV